jgi:hypothetical protein
MQFELIDTIARPQRLDPAVPRFTEHYRSMAIVRCKQGGLFETKWVPLASFKAVRLGSRRLQKCPVHRRWELVQRVGATTLSDEERAAVARYPAGRLP